MSDASSSPRRFTAACSALAVLICATAVAVLFMAAPQEPAGSGDSHWGAKSVTLAANNDSHWGARKN